jgi:crotonobetainyl-CoA:carnitine CoA-transferase CaiB-like acyl-CoA transferase
MAAALEGIRVLDLSESVAGQFCSRIMADHGAAVTLVEPPGGSVIRSRGPRGRAGDSLLFWHLNTGKGSIVLDWRTPVGWKHLGELCENADVVIVGPVLDRAPLRAVNPRLITCLVSEFGETGPYAAWQGSEMIHQALGGVMAVTGDEGRQPLYGTGQRAYYTAGATAYIGVMAALLARELTGEGQEVEATTMESVAAIGQNFATQYFYNGTFPIRGRYPNPLVTLQCRDGWVVLFALRRWPEICQVFGVLELAADPRFARLTVRMKNWDEAAAILREQVRGLSAFRLVEEGQARKVAISLAMDLQALQEDRHLRSRGFWQTVAAPDGDRMILGPMFRMSATPRHVTSPAPAPGQDNAAFGIGEAISS